MATDKGKVTVFRVMATYRPLEQHWVHIWTLLTGLNRLKEFKK